VSDQFMLPLEPAAHRDVTFAIGSIVFRCHAVDDGRFEWRSDNGRFVCGRNIGKGSHWARCGEHRVGQNFPTLRGAMLAAVSFEHLRAAA
jgi:hypothetical protein